MNQKKSWEGICFTYCKYGEGEGVQRSSMIGRIPIIGLNAHQKEKFFLRMLLYHVRGPTSWEDLRTVNGVVCETFHEACIKLGLFEDDSEIESKKKQFLNKFV